MLRSATFTGFVRDTMILNERVPINREGAAIVACNYSPAARTIYVDQSNGGVVWTNLVLAGTTTIVPYGIAWSFFVPTGDPTHIRIRLDAVAEGDGVFVKVETASPIAAYLNL